MFKKVMVANRGEIAHRLFRACHELGARTVAVYSEPDRGASWTQVADEGYLLPGATSADTYLNQAAILNIATEAGVDAIHPGYGFLSENADFAKACRDHGIKFIGPSPEAIRVMGSKATARAIAQQAGVPVIPGVDGIGPMGIRKTPQELLSAARIIGFPVLIKAAAGGGGKGMRVVWAPDTFMDALQAAQRESLSAFGDDHMLLEKYFTHVRHIEVQVLGDAHGQIFHLFERECSIQRRHQKIIEESPAATLSLDVRQQMAEAALALARAVNYESAGTVEFVVDDTGAFYLLEMNTRLQVEHPVTELVTGIDLASWQIRLAAGEPLGFAQADVRQRGHAIECRVYAEDPARDFLPSTGRLQLYRAPSGPGIRVDDGLTSGAEITPYYDPMLAKVITWGADRAEARRKMKRALNDMVVLGLTTNIPFLLAILDHAAFIAGQTPTRFLEENFSDWSPSQSVSEEQWLAIAALEHLGLVGRPSGVVSHVEHVSHDPWALANGWRNLNQGPEPMPGRESSSLKTEDPGNID